MLHIAFIRHCLALAEKGRGKTGINPMVGAVLVRQGKILAEGFHAEYGLPHAERALLRQCECGILPSDILYVNLEPCCHRNKKTPPCTDIIVERGIRHVVYGMKDPNPDVSGKGIEILNKKGVHVFGPILEQECSRLNRGFVSLMTKNRPWITLKKAQAIDGSIANDDGSPRKITSREQDAWSHEFLRARHDAILVGVGTVIADDPMLTVRLALASPGSRGERSEPRPGGEARGGGTGGRENPYRIILDPHLKIPLTARVLGLRTIVVATPGAKSEKKVALLAKGVRMIEVPFSSGAFDWHMLWQALMTPHGDFYGISSLLVEGGAKTWEMFKTAKMVDEEVTLVGE